jgi:hypothetical protein
VSRHRHLGIFSLEARECDRRTTSEERGLFGSVRILPMLVIILTIRLQPCRILSGTTEFVRPQADATLGQLCADRTLSNAENVGKFAGNGGRKCRRKSVETERKRVTA